MEDKLIITFDCDDDGAALLVSREIFDSRYETLPTRLEVINEFTGINAVALYNFLKKKENKDGQ